MSEVIDVTVVGGGPAGVACALLLQRQGVRTRLVSRSGSRPRPPELLAPPTATALRGLDIDVRDLGPAALACPKSSSAWSAAEAETFDYQLFMCRPAYAVDRSVLDAALIDRARECGVECVDAGVHHHERTDGQWAVHAAGMKLTSRFLVDATGKQGFTSGSRQRLHSDRLVALYTRWPRPRFDPMLCIEAMQDGWWYAMPAPGGGGYLVFMTDFDHLPQDRATRSSWLEAQFLQAGPIRDGSNCLPDFAAHKAMDARSSRASRFVDAGLVVLGDAAWSNDPLSGRGITMAIDQARRLSQALCEALSGGLGAEALRSYSDWCDSTYARSERARLQAYAAAGARFARRPFWSRRSG